MPAYPKAARPSVPWSGLRGVARRAWLLLTDPGRYSAERYAGSSRMHLSAVRPESWRKDVGPDAAPQTDPAGLAEPPASL